LFFPSGIGGALLSLLMGVQPAQLPVLEASPIRVKQVMAYRAIVEKYRRGEADAVDAVIAIQPQQLESIVKLIFGVPGMPWAPPGHLRASAMLHADAALRVTGLDEKDHEQRVRHLTVARRMLHASGPPDDPFPSRWYLAVSRMFRERQLLREAEDLLGRGRADAPGNPIVLYESGTVAENTGPGVHGQRAGR
jgi:hypothetical protein